MRVVLQKLVSVVDHKGINPVNAQIMAFDLVNIHASKAILLFHLSDVVQSVLCFCGISGFLAQYFIHADVHCK